MQLIGETVYLGLQSQRGKSASCWGGTAADGVMAGRGSRISNSHTTDLTLHSLEIFSCKETLPLLFNLVSGKSLGQGQKIGQILWQNNTGMPSSPAAVKILASL